MRGIAEITDHELERFAEVGRDLANGTISVEDIINAVEESYADMVADKGRDFMEQVLLESIAGYHVALALTCAKKDMITEALAKVTLEHKIDLDALFDVE